MTEVRPIIDLDYEATPDQMAVLMDGVEASLDHVVADTLIPERGYAGLLASAAGSVVTIGAGRLYQGGKVYASDTPVTFDVFGKSKLPVALRRIMLIVAYGTEADTDEGPISVLVEAQSTPDKPVYKQVTAAQNHRRLAVIQDAYGDEAANPVAPGYGLALPIAMAVLNPTGIGSLINFADGKVPNLADVAERVSAIEAFDAIVGPEISTLQATLAGLANRPGVNEALITRMLLSIASLAAKEGIPTNAADSSADYLLDGTNSDLTHPLSNCKVQEGVRFPDENASAKALARFQTYDPSSVILGGVLMPAYTRYLRGTTGAITGAVPANGYTYQNISYVQKTIARTRVRYGSEFTVCSNSAYWQSGSYDPITGIFKLPNGETFKAALDIDVTEAKQVRRGDLAVHNSVRLQEFWTDSYNETYWDQVVQAPQVVSGFHLAETVLIGQDQWIDAVGFQIAALDAQGDVTVLIVEAGDNAAPDADAVLARVTVPYAQLKAGVETVAGLTTPIFVTAGQRISYILVTVAAHKIATTEGASFPQGTFFALSPTGFAQGDLTRHLYLAFYGCKFAQSVISIQLAGLNLDGGMTSIDVLASTIVPNATTLTYEIQIASAWVPLNGANIGRMNAGGSLPPDVPFRVTMAGNPDVMPALDLGHSQVLVSRPAKSLAHIWPKLPRTPPVSSAQIRVIERYEDYDPLQHVWGCKLLTGAGYLTQTAPSSFSDVLTDDGSLERTYVFNLAAAVRSYKVLTLGTITTPLSTDHVAWIKDFVL